MALYVNGNKIGGGRNSISLNNGNSFYYRRISILI